MTVTTIPAPARPRCARRSVIAAFAFGFAFGIGLVGQTTAIAAPPAPDSAEAAIQRGIELRKRRQDREALAEFQRALRIRETPRALAQLGLAEQALGQWIAAEEHIAAALKSENDDWIKRNQRALNDALAAVGRNLGTVEIWGEPAVAEVVVNGQPSGRLSPPTQVRVVAGAAVIYVRAAGHQELSRNVHVSAGGLVRENVNLVPLAITAQSSEPANQAGGGAHGSAPAVAGGGAAAPDGSNPMMVQASSDERDTNAWRTAAWIAGGASLAMVGLGVYGAITASNRLTDFQKTPASNGMRSCGTDLPNYGGSQCSDIHGEWQTARTVTLVGFIGAGVLAGASAALWIWSSNADQASPAVSALACAPRVSGELGIGCGLRF